MAGAPEATVSLVRFCSPLTPRITVPSLSVHREHARAAGADVSDISPRANQAHSYMVDDPEGQRWYLSEPLCRTGTLHPRHMTSEPVQSDRKSVPARLGRP